MAIRTVKLTETFDRNSVSNVPAQLRSAMNKVDFMNWFRNFLLLRGGSVIIMDNTP